MLVVWYVYYDRTVPETIHSLAEIFAHVKTKQKKRTEMTQLSRDENRLQDTQNKDDIFKFMIKNNVFHPCDILEILDWQYLQEFLDSENERADKSKKKFIKIDGIDNWEIDYPEFGAIEKYYDFLKTKLKNLREENKITWSTSFQ